MSHHKIVAAFMLFAALPLRAAEPERETLDAWDQYLRAANANMADRAKGCFLWVAESAERLRRVRTGEIVVSPLGHTPRKVPGGLIHHWIGAAFIPAARIDDVIAVVRDYDRYTEFYKPSVIDARTLSRNAAGDTFSVVMFDKTLFMKRALESEYESRFVQLDDARWYSVSATTRIRELSNDRRTPDGEGSGYIWRLCTISRFEERDGGVYVETEAMALSRPIPATLHWVVDPIVRRVSRESLSTSLRQTEGAVLSSRTVVRNLKPGPAQAFR